MRHLQPGAPRAGGTKGASQVRAKTSGSHSPSHNASQRVGAKGTHLLPKPLLPAKLLLQKLPHPLGQQLGNPAGHPLKSAGVAPMHPAGHPPAVVVETPLVGVQLPPCLDPQQAPAPTGHLQASPSRLTHNKPLWRPHRALLPHLLLVHQLGTSPGMGVRVAMGLRPRKVGVIRKEVEAGKARAGAVATIGAVAAVIGLPQASASEDHLQRLVLLPEKTLFCANVCLRLQGMLPQSHAQGVTCRSWEGCMAALQSIQ